MSNIILGYSLCPASDYLQAWSKPFKQSLPEQAWPAARSLHTACSLLDPHEVESPSHCMPYADQQLLVVWGKGQDTKHCNDIWILNTVTMQWKEASCTCALMWYYRYSVIVKVLTRSMFFLTFLIRACLLRPSSHLQVCHLSFCFPELYILLLSLSFDYPNSSFKLW